MPVTKTMEFHIAYIWRSLDCSFSKELPSEIEFSNVVDCYTVAMKKDSSDNIPSGFEVARFLVKYSSLDINTKDLTRNSQNLTTQNKS